MEQNNTITPEMIKKADYIVSKCQCKLWWIDKQDLKQVALLSMVLAKNTYNKDIGSFENYAYMSAWYNVRTFLKMQNEYNHRGGISFFGIDCSSHDEQYKRDVVSSEDALIANESLRAVRNKILEILKRKNCDAVLPVLFKEKKAVEVAKELNCAVGKIHYLTNKAREILKNRRNELKELYR